MAANWYDIWLARQFNVDLGPDFPDISSPPPSRVPPAGEPRDVSGLPPNFNTGIPKSVFAPAPSPAFTPAPTPPATPFPKDYGLPPLNMSFNPTPTALPGEPPMLPPQVVYPMANPPPSEFTPPPTGFPEPPSNLPTNEFQFPEGVGGPGINPAPNDFISGPPIDVYQPPGFYNPPPSDNPIANPIAPPGYNPPPDETMYPTPVTTPYNPPPDETMYPTPITTPANPAPDENMSPTPVDQYLPPDETPPDEVTPDETPVPEPSVTNEPTVAPPDQTPVGGRFDIGTIFGGLPEGFTEDNRFGGGAPTFTGAGATGPQWTGGSIFGGTVGNLATAIGLGGNLGGGGSIGYGGTGLGASLARAQMLRAMKGIYTSPAAYSASQFANSPLNALTGTPAPSYQQFLQSQVELGNILKANPQLLLGATSGVVPRGTPQKSVT